MAEPDHHHPELSRSETVIVVLEIGGCWAVDPVEWGMAAGAD